MKVLVVRSGNSVKPRSFVQQQIQGLRDRGIEVDDFAIQGRGVIGYLRCLPKLRAWLKQSDYDLVHAHFGLSGMLAVLQRRCPTVITFHGSDVNTRRNCAISSIASRLSSYNIFVERSMADRLGARARQAVIPCGVDLREMIPMDQQQCREELGIQPEAVVILFASAFSRPEKNYPLARTAVAGIEGAVLLELDGYSRREVVQLLNAADVLLMTSVREGSPVIIKEALACNCPIVSTDVGDVRDMIGDTRGCYVTSSDAREISTKLRSCLANRERTNGREAARLYSQDETLRRICEVYAEVLDEKEQPYERSPGDATHPCHSN